jgi:phage/plasmid-like protein (TIGR03299 family)
MAHLVETMAYAGAVPWHGLGVPVANDLTAKEMMDAAKLNWRVEKKPLFVISNGRNIVVPSQCALMRDSDDQIMSIITDDWNPVQNEEAFDFFKEFVDAGDMEMHTAGSLKSGRMVWALAKIKQSFSLFNGKDEIESHLLFSNPHEYGKSIDIRFTPIRVVCNNTLTLALGSKSDLTVRMNHRAEFNPEKVKEALGIATKKLGKYKDVAEFLASKKFKTETVLDYFNELFPHTKANDDDESDEELKISRPARLSFDALDKQPGHALGEGTWWNAFNSVTYNIDHVLGHKPESRLNSAWYGPNRAKKIQALELASEFAMVA